MLKKLAIFLGFLLIVVLGFAAFVYVKTEQSFNRVFDISVAEIELLDEEALADGLLLEEGRRLYLSRGCVDCHGENLGGHIVVNDPLAGVLAGSNLTSGKGGLNSNFYVQDFIAAIRHGLNYKKQPLRFMPSQDYAEMSDEQIALLIAYITSAPPVDAEAQLKLGPAIRLMHFLGEVPLAADLIDHKKDRPKAVVEELSVAYGEYVASTCIGCHGERFSGGQVPGTPPDFKPAANLTPHVENGLGKWTEADFMIALREGKRPDGSMIDEFMPWKVMKHMTDVEIKAMWLYFQSIPALEYGNR